MIEFLSNVITKTSLVAAITIVVFHTILLLIGNLTKNNNIYLKVLLFFLCVFYIGIYKINFHDSQGEPRSIIPVITIFYLFTVLFFFSKNKLKIFSAR